MKITHTMAIMFIGSFIFMYWIMSMIMVPKIIYVKNSLGNLYLTLGMSFFMVFIEVVMHDMHYGSMSYPYLIFFGSLTVLSLYMYRKRVYIDDKEYLKEMIEHHSMALLTSEDILKKTNDYHVTKLAKNIIQTQQDEIREMESILAKQE